MKMYQAQSMPGYRMIIDTLVYTLISTKDYFLSERQDSEAWILGTGNWFHPYFQYNHPVQIYWNYAVTYIEGLFVLYFWTQKSVFALVSKMTDQVRNKNVYVIYKRMKKKEIW